MIQFNRKRTITICQGGGEVLAAERRFKIMKLVQKQKVVTTSELAALFDISEMTIRRDVTKLSQDGLLEKTHGGAMANEIITLGPSYIEKEIIHLKEKKSIGLAAAELIERGDIIALNAGTTTLQVAKNIKDNMNLTVVTNAINIGMKLAERGDIKLILPGGTLRERSFALVGTLTEKALAEIRVNKVFLGANGVSVEHGITTSDLLEALTDKAMIKIAKEVIVVADHSKIGKVSLTPIISFSEIDKIITDSSISKADREALENSGKEVIIAK